MKKFISLLLVMLMLCGVCGVQAFAADASELPGVYTMVDMNDGETENAAELLAMMAAMGMAPTLTINEDGSAVVDFFGETFDLVFDFDTQTAVSEGEPLAYEHNGDTVTFSKDGLYMVFSKSGIETKKGVGAYSYYELVGYVDEKGLDFSEDFIQMREAGQPISLKLFDSGDALFDNLGQVTELHFDFENMTVTATGTDDVQPFTLEDGMLLVGAEDGEHMLLELSDPGWVGDYAVVAMESEGEDITEQLSMLAAMGMAPTLSIDENGDGVLSVFGVEVKMHFDFDAMLVSSDEDDTTIPFSYKLGKLTMENDGALMVFSRAVRDENAVDLSSLIGQMG